MVFNDSLPQPDESAELRAHADTAYIPAPGADVRTTTGPWMMTQQNQAKMY